MGGWSPRCSYALVAESELGVKLLVCPSPLHVQHRNESKPIGCDVLGDLALQYEEPDELRSQVVGEVLGFLRAYRTCQL